MHAFSITPVAEHYSVDVLRRARNVPPRLPLEAAEDGRVLNYLVTRAEHQCSSGFHQNEPGHAAESLKEGMKIIGAQGGLTSGSAGW